MRIFPDKLSTVLGGLRRRFWRAGRGSIARTAQALRLRPSYFSEKWARPPDTFDVGVLLAALEDLGIPPGTFFHQIFPASGGGGIWEGGPDPVEERATPATRQAARLAYRRMRAELGIDLDAGDLGAGDVEAGEITAGESVEVSPGAPADPGPGPGPTLGAEWLEDLDGRRHTEPGTVIEELAEHLHQIEPELLPRALGIWGSALWFLIDLEAAAYINLRALRLAGSAGDDAAMADLLQRRAHIMGDAGDHGRALEYADLSAGIAGRIRGQPGKVAAGRAAVDQSWSLYYLDRPRESDRAAKRALELLPEESLPRNRFAAYAGRCLCCLKLGKPRQAQDFAEAAERLPVGPWDRGKLAWIRASISRKLGNRSDRIDHLRSGAELFRTLHYGDTLLISLELVQELLEDDQHAEAVQICRGLFDLVESVRANPIISGALTELLRVTLAKQGQGLSLELVRQLRAKVGRERNRKNAKARRAWRALAAG